MCSSVMQFSFPTDTGASSVLTLGSPVPVAATAGAALGRLGGDAGC